MSLKAPRWQLQEAVLAGAESGQEVTGVRQQEQGPRPLPLRGPSPGSGLAGQGHGEPLSIHAGFLGSTAGASGGRLTPVLRGGKLLGDRKSGPGNLNRPVARGTGQGSVTGIRAQLRLNLTHQIKTPRSALDLQYDLASL